jgi:hypothetical protein
MRRRLLIGLLALGTIGGFGSGIASMMGAGRCHQSRREAFERHVAQVCVDAAMRSREGHEGHHRHGPPPSDRY